LAFAFAIPNSPYFCRKIADGRKTSTLSRGNLVRKSRDFPYPEDVLVRRARGARPGGAASGLYLRRGAAMLQMRRDTGVTGESAPMRPATDASAIRWRGDEERNSADFQVFSAMRSW
jgi:hypothetical protein